jgi:hypothetical protein
LPINTAFHFDLLCIISDKDDRAEGSKSLVGGVSNAK